MEKGRGGRGGRRRRNSDPRDRWIKIEATKKKKKKRRGWRKKNKSNRIVSEDSTSDQIKSFRIISMEVKMKLRKGDKNLISSCGQYGSSWFYGPCYFCP
jgi:hypothetical protein